MSFKYKNIYTVFRMNWHIFTKMQQVGGKKQAYAWRNNYQQIHIK